MEFKLSQKRLSKILKSLPPEFEEKVQSEDVEALKTRLKNIQTLAYETRIAVENDSALNKAKEEVRLLSEDYKATLKETEAMTDFLLYTLAERGVE